jgi:hypothetical protein
LKSNYTDDVQRKEGELILPFCPIEPETENNRGAYGRGECDSFVFRRVDSCVFGVHERGANKHSNRKLIRFFFFSLSLLLSLSHSVHPNDQESPFTWANLAKINATGSCFMCSATSHLINALVCPNIRSMWTTQSALKVSARLARPCLVND